MPKVQAGDIRMHYKVLARGTGEELDELDPSQPTMVVWHGGFGIIDHQIEVAAWQHFSSHVQLVFPDQRGHGQTEDGDPALWTMDQHGKDVHAFTEAVGLGKTAVHAGVSAGGYALISYGVQFPSHAKGLVLCDTEATPSAEARRDVYLSLATRADKGEFTAFKDKSDAEITAMAKAAADASYAFDTAEAFDEEKWAAFCEHCFPLISKGAFEFVEPARTNMALKKSFLNGVGKFDYGSMLGTLTSPVLWLAGEYDPLHPRCGAEAGVKALNSAGNDNAALVILNAGDPVYTDAMSEFTEAVTDFFARLGVEQASSPSCRM